MDAVNSNDVIDLTKSPPDPAPAPPLQNNVVSMPSVVPAVTAGAPIIRPRVLFPVSLEGSLALHPIITVPVKIFSVPRINLLISSDCSPQRPLFLGTTITKVQRPGSSNNNHPPPPGVLPPLVKPRKKVCLRPPPSQQEIFTRFFNFSQLETQFVGKGPMKKRISIYDGKKFNPFEATLQNVADFFFYLEVTEEVTTAHQTACLTGLARYLPHLGLQFHAGEVSEGFRTFLLPFFPSFTSKEDRQAELQLLQNSLGFLGSGDRTWEGFSAFCLRSQTDPFLASPILVGSYIRHVLFRGPDRARDLQQLSRSYNFYSKNIELICGRLDKIFNKNPLLQHPEVHFPL